MRYYVAEQTTVSGGVYYLMEYSTIIEEEETIDDLFSIRMPATSAGERGRKQRP